MSALKAPLRFLRKEVLKPWGGRSLERCPGIELRESGPVGETWEIVDRPGDEQSVVASEAFQGRTLRELVAEHGEELLGRAKPTPKGRFPLLIKYLDAQKNLSVQVHPDDSNAGLIEGAEAKTEAWYFLDVTREEPRPGDPEPRLGRIYAGLKRGTDAERFAPVAGSRASLEHMDVWDAEPGQCLVVPGGTVHAIGAGVSLLEVQQNSDTTYRMWDWDRVGDDGKPRETHLTQALQVTRYDLPERPPVAPVFQDAADGLRSAPMARTNWFAMNVLEFERGARLSTRSQFQIYAAVEGRGQLTVRGEAPVEMNQGDVWLLPAAAGFHDVEPAGGSLRLVQLLTRA